MPFEASVKPARGSSLASPDKSAVFVKRKQGQLIIENKAI
jgi:hypothetical protein